MATQGNLLALADESMARYGWLAVNLRIRLVRRLGELPLGFHTANPSGKLRKIIEKNADNTENFIAHQLPDLAQAVVTPVAFLNDTIYNNIKIGKKDATRAEIIAAARTARCEEFIQKLPQGYDTVIGENGKTLSGGERQRLSIARALLKDASIILLDEATASLDPENETLIQEAIGRLIKDKTVLIIAHRLRSVENCDQIIVLKEGKIVETGRHRELMDLNGLYRHLVELQRASSAWEVGAVRQG